MNADAFRHFYDYYFAENRKLWGYVTSLSDELFTRSVPYSHGSVRDQILHLIVVENIWFSELAHRDPVELMSPEQANDRNSIRASWDSIEQNTRAYLDALQDDMLFDTPIIEPDEDKDLIVWQVLLHVVNHSTDHRAQLLRQLSDLGVETTWQDYIFYVYGHPLTKNRPN